MVTFSRFDETITSVIFHYKLNKLYILIDFWLGNWWKQVLKPYNNFLRECIKFLTPLKHRNCLLFDYTITHSFIITNVWNLSNFVDFGLGIWLKKVINHTTNLGVVNFWPPIKHHLFAKHWFWKNTRNLKKIMCPE